MTWLAVVALLAAGFGWLRHLGGRHNVTDWGSPGLNRLEGLNRLFCARFHRLRPASFELPESGGAVVVSNHISGLDPVALIAASPRPLRFLIATEEYERWWLKWFFKSIGCIPVDRTGRPQKALREALKALDRGDVVAVFPQGRIVTRDEPPARLKRGAVFLADVAAVPIIPLRVEGVRAEGITIGAVLVRSNLVLHAGEPLGPELSTDERMAAIARFIVPGTASNAGDSPTSAATPESR